MSPPVLRGVCGVEAAESGLTAGCGAPFAIGPVGVTVVRWETGHPSAAWQVVGRCGECGHVVVLARCTSVVAKIWLDEGAGLVKVARPVELDDPRRSKRVPVCEDEMSLDGFVRAAFLGVTVESLGAEVAAVAEEMGR